MSRTLLANCINFSAWQAEKLMQFGRLGEKIKMDLILI